jgi:hypothetical protein
MSLFELAELGQAVDEIAQGIGMQIRGSVGTLDQLIEDCDRFGDRRPPWLQTVSGRADSVPSWSASALAGSRHSPTGLQIVVHGAPFAWEAGRTWRQSDGCGRCLWPPGRAQASD